VKLEVYFFHLFSCPNYIHIPEEKMNKLEPLSTKGIFVGYNETSEACKIYIPTQ